MPSKNILKKIKTRMYASVVTMLLQSIVINYLKLRIVLQPWIITSSYQSFTYTVTVEKMVGNVH